jgi:hypothetical protein
MGALAFIVIVKNLNQDTITMKIEITIEIPYEIQPNRDILSFAHSSYHIARSPDLHTVVEYQLPFSCSTMV